MKSIFARISLSLLTLVISIVATGWSFLAAAANLSVHSTTEEKRPNANSDPIYMQLRSAKLSGEYSPVENLILKRDMATITFRTGSFHFLVPVEGRVTGAVFAGQGEFQMAPVLAVEQKNLSILTGTPDITERFAKMVLRFTDTTYEEIKKANSPKTGPVNSQQLAPHRWL